MRYRRLLLAVAFAAALTVSWLSILSSYRKTIVIDGYVSDEQWYVVASVNMLRKIFGVEPDTHVNATHSLYTFVVNGDPYECATEASRLAPIEVKGYNTVKISSFTAIVGDDDLNLIRSLPCVVDVFPGLLPDELNVNQYMNWEHPLLVKMEIAASLLLFGYHPWAWRLPSLIAGMALAVLVLATVVAVEGSTVYAVLGLLVAGAFLALDPSVKTMSSVAMLDIHVALFTVASLLAAVRGRVLAASLLLGLAASSKYTGFFTVPALYAIAVSRGFEQRKAILYTIVVPVAVVLATWTPGIAYLGGGWLGELLGSLRWHLSSRPPGGPPSTSALGLTLCLSSFPLYFIDSYDYMSATCLPQLMVVGMASAALTLLAHLPWRGWRGRAYPALYLYSAVAGYWAVYAAGNRTLYQFYSVHFTPLAALAASQLPLTIAVLNKFEEGELRSGLQRVIAEALAGVRGYSEHIAAATLLLTSLYTATHRTSSWTVMGLASTVDVYGYEPIPTLLAALLYLMLASRSRIFDTLLLAVTVSVNGYSYQTLIDAPLSTLLAALKAPALSWALAGPAFSTPLPSLLAGSRLAALASTSTWLAVELIVNGFDAKAIAVAATMTVLTLVGRLWRFRDVVLPVIDAAIGAGLAPLWPLAADGGASLKAMVAGLAVAYASGAGLPAGLAASAAAAAYQVLKLRERNHLNPPQEQSTGGTESKG